jgi:hypothetical protein
MGFPAKLTYVCGQAIRPYEMTNKQIDQLTYDELVEIKEKVRADMQRQLKQAVANYGNKPYHFREFIKNNLLNLDKFPYSMPVGWPLLFEYFNRQWRKNKIDEKPLRLGFLSTLKIIFQSPKQLFFYLPILGWIPMLIQGISKKSENQPPT